MQKLIGIVCASGTRCSATQTIDLMGPPTKDGGFVKIDNPTLVQYNCQDDLTVYLGYNQSKIKILFSVSLP